jgi:hypothetical protein
LKTLQWQQQLQKGAQLGGATAGALMLGAAVGAAPAIAAAAAGAAAYAVVKGSAANPDNNAEMAETNAVAQAGAAPGPPLEEGMLQ